MENTKLEDLRMWIGLKREMMDVPEVYRSLLFMHFLTEIEQYIFELTELLTHEQRIAAKRSNN
jgi:hypothetical protein